MAHNSFYHRGAIRESTCFYDRQHETEQIATLLRTSQSVSIVGPRRIGKTSLLYHLLDEKVRADYGLLPSAHVIASRDAEGMEQASLSEVYALFINGILEAIGEDGKAEVRAASYRDLDSQIKSLHQSGTQVAFFIDEFDLLAANQNLDPAFFSGLRGLATRYAVSYVLTSQRPLISLVYADDSVLSSPFFNIFATVPLGLFDASTARQMVMHFLSKGAMTLPQLALDAIAELAGPHPFFVQIAAYHACELMRSVDKWDERSTAQLSDRFYDEAHQHYLYYWYGLDEMERNTLANLVAAQHDPGKREELYRLRLQCLIIPIDSGYRYVSSALLRFVRRQQVEGLVQVEPFVIDLLRRTVTVAGESLELSKTQFELLVQLAQRGGQVVTNRELEAHVWQDEYVGDPERLKAAIKHLRHGLGSWAACVANVRGVGYALRARRR
mgnify:CR=1 FL=1